VGGAKAKGEVKDGGEMKAPTSEELASITGVQHLQTPSPKEMQVILSKSGVNMSPPADRNFANVGTERDSLAVQTGVLLADLVLTVNSVGKDKQVSYLTDLKSSCEKLNVGSDIPLEIQTVIDEVESGALADQKLVQKFDELHGVMVPELEQEDAKWLVPLVQAGSWLEGAHLVSAAFKGQSDLSAAEGILKQRGVVEYFQTYVNERAAQSNAPAAGVIKTLQATLEALHTVAVKAGPLDNSDIETIHSETGKVLDILN
jgi:hypothetical protein